MKKLIIGTLLLLSAQVAFGAPLDRSIREIRDIVSSPELRRYLPSTERILDIRRVERGYLILTNRYQLFVEVMYGQLQGAQAEAGGEEDRDSGPGKLHFNEPTELNKQS